MTVKTEKVTQLLEGFNQVDWFSSTGTVEGREEIEVLLAQFKAKTDLTAYATKWISEEEFKQLSDVDLEGKLQISELLVKNIELMKTVALENGNEHVVSNAVDSTGDELFHQVYDAAYKVFEDAGLEAVKKAVQIAVLTSAATLAEEALKESKDGTFGILTKILGEGRLPLGVKNGEFYIL